MGLYTGALQLQKSKLGHDRTTESNKRKKKKKYNQVTNLLHLGPSRAWLKYAHVHCLVTAVPGCPAFRITDTAAISSGFDASCARARPRRGATPNTAVRSCKRGATPNACKRRAMREGAHVQSAIFYLSARVNGETEKGTSTVMQRRSNGQIVVFASAKNCDF